MNHSRRTPRWVALLIAGALVATACDAALPEIEPLPGDPPTAAPGPGLPPPDPGPAPPPVGDTTTPPPDPKAPPATDAPPIAKPPSPTEPPTTEPPAVPPSTEPPTTEPPPTTTPPDHGGHDGMPHVDRSLIPVGSPGTGARLVAAGAGPPDPNDIPGAIVMLCDFSHMNFDDPIVFPGVRDATHLHAFFGNTGASHASTIDSVRSTGNSTCRGGVANRSSYWVPALIDTRTSRPVRPREVVVYYTHGNLPGPEISAHPAGLQILAGDARATGPQPHVNWWCRGNDNGYSDYISPNCRSDEDLKLTVVFPQCWNGRDLWSSDQSHMAYSTRGGGCPGSHPVAVPQLNLSVIWPLDGEPPTALRLSSDMYSHDRPGGYSGHADWFDGWSEDVKQTFVTECIHREVYCFAQLGNGQRLDRP